MSLRNLRIKRGLTQRQLALIAHYPQPNISNLETGIMDIRKLELANAIKLADALDCADLRDLI